MKQQQITEFMEARFPGFISITDGVTFGLLNTPNGNQLAVAEQVARMMKRGSLEILHNGGPVNFAVTQDPSLLSANPTDEEVKAYVAGCSFRSAETGSVVGYYAPEERDSPLLLRYMHHRRKVLTSVETLNVAAVEKTKRIGQTSAQARLALRSINERKIDALENTVKKLK